ncbi:hypothetical protein FQZ97_959880 [compost metagenome]
MTGLSIAANSASPLAFHCTSSESRSTAVPASNGLLAKPAMRPWRDIWPPANACLPDSIVTTRQKPYCSACSAAPECVGWLAFRRCGRWGMACCCGRCSRFLGRNWRAMPGRKACAGWMTPPTATRNSIAITCGRSSCPGFPRAGRVLSPIWRAVPLIWPRRKGCWPNWRSSIWWRPTGPLTMEDGACHRCNWSRCAS